MLSALPGFSLSLFLNLFVVVGETAFAKVSEKEEAPAAHLAPGTAPRGGANMALLALTSRSSDSGAVAALPVGPPSPPSGGAVIGSQQAEVVPLRLEWRRLGGKLLRGARGVGIVRVVMRWV